MKAPPPALFAGPRGTGQPTQEIALVPVLTVDSIDSE